MARNNGHFKAAKCLVLYVDKNVWEKLRAENSSGLPTFLRRLKAIGLSNFQVFLLAVDRPLTYSDSLDLAGLTANHQLELSGGVADAVDKDAIATGVRETYEEYGCTAADVAMTAPLVAEGAHVAYDAGGQVEIYSISVAVVTQKPSPPRREGTIPDKCVLVPLLEAEEFLMEQGRQGILLEGLALTALSHLGLALHGGWNSLR